MSPVKKKNKNDEDEETSAINDLEKQTETETKSNTNTKTNDKTETTEKKKIENSTKNKDQIEVSKTVLIYDGIDITEADKDSLKENQYVVDNIISFAIANYYIKNKQKIDDKNIVLVRPPQAMMLKAGDKLTVRNLKKELKMKGCSSVVIPVNDSEDLNKWSGGGHWTVLVWNIEKNSFHHLDSIPGKKTSSMQRN